MPERLGDWTQVRSGRQFWPLDPHPEDVDIEDIAWGLAMQCRYAGQCNRFYSVAEHSVLISMSVPPEHALAGLLHDAGEAYIGDIPGPLKRFLPQFQEVENRLMACIAQRFRFPWPMSPAIACADRQILLNERAVLFGEAHNWDVAGAPLPGIEIACLSPQSAYSLFKERFEALERNS